MLCEIVYTTRVVLLYMIKWCDICTYYLKNWLISISIGQWAPIICLLKQYYAIWDSSCKRKITFSFCSEFWYEFLFVSRRKGRVVVPFFYSLTQMTHKMIESGIKRRVNTLKWYSGFKLPWNYPRVREVK